MQVPFTARVLEYAYRNGYFPMADPDTDEINWYRPDPRAVIPLESFHVSRSLRQTLRNEPFRVSFNQAFEQTMKECAQREEGSWISQPFLEAYGDLHAQGKAASVEIWQYGKLVGGAYGVCLEAAFFAESMFHRVTDASKVALYHLTQELKRCGYQLLEVQFLTDHLKSLGAIEVSDEAYEKLLHNALKAPAKLALGTGLPK
ncbi:leucyl/phenylalanyl-tRNA--protein transferase [bacterium]|nr:leucyl/phenylalanyl-tRNA--protein transferase [bacterium]